jgi:hypothetical protein
VGTALVRHTIALAKEMGYRAVLFHGNPDYYPRLGFRPAFEFGVGRKLEEHFHCMPLYEGALDGISHGRHVEMDIRLPKWQVRLYSRRFPPPDFSWVKPIEVLLDQLEPPAREAIAGLGFKTLYQMCRQSEASIKAMLGTEEAALETIRRVMRECSEHFHCMPLYEGALDGISHGRYVEMDVRLPKWQVRLYNRRFPPPDLSWVKPIEVLLYHLEPPAREAIAGLGFKTLYQMCRQSEASVAALPGMDKAALGTIRRVMRECNYGWGREQAHKGGTV